MIDMCIPKIPNLLARLGRESRVSICSTLPCILPIMTKHYRLLSLAHAVPEQVIGAHLEYNYTDYCKFNSNLCFYN